MIFPIPGGKKIGSHYLPRYTRYRVIAGRVIKGGHCISNGRPYLFFSVERVEFELAVLKQRKIDGERRVFQDK